VQDLDLPPNTEDAEFGFAPRPSHPLLDHAVSLFPEDRDSTKAPETISKVRPTCYKVKTSRYRGAAYISDNGQVWLVAGGIRREGDTDDFYSEFMSETARNGRGWWLPSDEDVALATYGERFETLIEWERSIYDALGQHLGENELQIPFEADIVSPFEDKGRPISRIRVDLLDFDGESLGIEVAVQTLRWEFRDTLERLAWHAILCRIDHREQKWSVSTNASGNLSSSREFSDTFSVQEVIDGTHSSGVPVVFLPGEAAHRISHFRAPSLTDATVNGDPVRSLCGKVFVPRQDHEVLDECDDCKKIVQALKKQDAGSR
jgi:hypothetical protein